MRVILMSQVANGVLLPFGWERYADTGYAK